MTLRGYSTAALAVAVVGTALAAAPARAQETAIKGGISVSRLQTTPGAEYWDDRLIATGFGGHVRLRFGPLTFQPELLVLTKGATASQPFPPQLEDDQIRMEYIEVPLLVVVPVAVGAFEPYVAGGPALMMESRCRSVVRQDGLRTNLPCDPPSGRLFSRRTFDYGLVAAGGAAYPIGGGRVLLEARHTWGMRNVHSGPGDAEVRNRTFAIMIGYAMGWDTSN
jgi:hypothetical protein